MNVHVNPFQAALASSIGLTEEPRAKARKAREKVPQEERERIAADAATGLYSITDMCDRYDRHPATIKRHAGRNAKYRKCQNAAITAEGRIALMHKIKAGTPALDVAADNNVTVTTVYRVERLYSSDIDCRRLRNIIKGMIAGDRFYQSSRYPRITNEEIHDLRQCGFCPVVSYGYGKAHAHAHCPEDQRKDWADRFYGVEADWRKKG